MIEDFHEYAGDLADWRPDVVVVGFGPVGMAVVDVLRRRGRRVLVLEAGPYRAERGHPSTEVELLGMDFTGGLGRGVGLGGGSAFWAGQTMRFHALDFTRRDWIPGSGWPLSMDDLLPYYAQAEAFLGVSADDYYSHAWHRYGVDPLALEDQKTQTRMSIFVPKTDLFKRSRRTLNRDQDLLVLFNARVTEFKRHDGSVSSVIVRSQFGPVADISAQSFVICVGALETARLLLAPSTDFPSGIGNHSGHVGRHFQDHPNGTIAAVTGTHEQLTQLVARYALFYWRRSRLLPKIVATAAEQERAQVLNACAIPVYTWNEESVTGALKQVQQAVAGRQFDLGIPARLASAIGKPGALARTLRGRVQGRPYVEVPQAVGLQVFVEQPPDGMSSVTLSDTRDMLGIPMARLNWAIGEEEVRAARNIVRLVGDLFCKANLGNVKPLAELAEPGGFQRLVEDYQHHAGTARMAASESAGVCDVRGRVFGLNNLYVAGGALFPTSSYANPTLTMMAIGLYVASFIP